MLCFKIQIQILFVFIYLFIYLFVFVLKNRGPRSKLPHSTKIINKRKLPVHDHMTHVAKTDILTGHEEIGNLQFIVKIIFHCIFIENPCIFSNLERV